MEKRDDAWGTVRDGHVFLNPVLHVAGPSPTTLLNPEVPLRVLLPSSIPRYEVYKGWSRLTSILTLTDYRLTIKVVMDRREVAH